MLIRAILLAAVGCLPFAMSLLITLPDSLTVIAIFIAFISLGAGATMTIMAGLKCLFRPFDDLEGPEQAVWRSKGRKWGDWAWCRPGGALV